jgi:ParB family chromosome partitioning protein
MSKQALGKGFDGLIPIDFDLGSVVNKGEQIREIAIELIVANPDQPRKNFDEKSLEELAQSISQHGIIQPIVVSNHLNSTYRIVAGERRWRASQIAGLKKLPVIVRNHKELEEIEIALVENIQRVDLSPLETAVSIVKLRDQFSLTPKQISKKLGKAETTVSNIIRLLQLPEQAVKAMQENRISEGHARTILALKTDEKAQLELLNKIIVQSMSVRDAERYVHEHKSILAADKNQYSAETKKIVSALPRQLSDSISIREKSKKGSGVITIKYKTLQELKKYLLGISS